MDFRSCKKKISLRENSLPGRHEGNLSPAFKHCQTACRHRERHLRRKRGNPIDAKEDFPDDENEDTPVIKSDNTPIIKNVNTPIIKNDKENSKEINTKGVNKSVSQSIEKEKKQKTDELTDEIREKLKRQIEYDFFEENFPEDLPGVDVLVDCMAEMLLSPYTKINGIAQRRSVLKPYIDKVDADTIREFLDHMRGKKMRDVKNISAYWQSALINFIKEEELVMLTI